MSFLLPHYLLSPSIIKLHSMSFLLLNYILSPSIIVSPLSMSFLFPHYLLPPSIIVHHSLCPSFSLTIYCPHPSLYTTLYVLPSPSLSTVPIHNCTPLYVLSSPSLSTVHINHCFTTLYVLPSPSLSTASIHHCTPLSMSLLLPHYLLSPSIIVSPLSMSFLLPHYLLSPSIIVSPLSMSLLLPHYLLSPSIIVHHSPCPSFSLTIYCPHPSLFHHHLRSYGPYFSLQQIRLVLLNVI